jgi:hypothetical protein
MIDVPYVPGGRVYRSEAARSVTGNGQKDVTGGYKCSDPRAGTHRRSPRVTTDRDGHGILAVLTVAAVALIADGAALMLVAWWQQ